MLEFGEEFSKMEKENNRNYAEDLERNYPKFLGFLFFTKVGVASPRVYFCCVCHLS